MKAAIIVIFLWVCVLINSIPTSEALFNPYAPKNTITNPGNTSVEPQPKEIFIEKQPTQKQIGIKISDSCKTMLKNNFTTNCPTYSEINLVFPDTTNPDISGAFILKDGIIERDFPKMKSSFRYYPQVTNQTVLWLDPPNDVQNYLDVLITIEPQLPLYKIPSSGIMDNYNIVFGNLRWVDNYCHAATITAPDWIFILGDTINLILNDCQEGISHINDKFVLEREKSYQDLTTVYRYKLDRWVDEIKENCLNNYGCSVSQPDR